MVGMNTFLVFTLVMDVAGLLQSPLERQLLLLKCFHCCTRICRCDHVKCRCLPLLEDLQIRFVAVFPSITAVILASKLQVL